MTDYVQDVAFIDLIVHGRIILDEAIDGSEKQKRRINRREREEANADDSVSLKILRISVGAFFRAAATCAVYGAALLDHDTFRSYFMDDDDDNLTPLSSDILNNFIVKEIDDASPEKLSEVLRQRLLIVFDSLVNVITEEEAVLGIREEFFFSKELELRENLELDLARGGRGASALLDKITRVVFKCEMAVAVHPYLPTEFLPVGSVPNLDGSCWFSSMLTCILHSDLMSGIVLKSVTDSMIIHHSTTEEETRDRRKLFKLALESMVAAARPEVGRHPSPASFLKVLHRLLPNVFPKTYNPRDLEFPSGKGIPAQLFGNVLAKLGVSCVGLVNVNHQVLELYPEQCIDKDEDEVTEVDIFDEIDDIFYTASVTTGTVERGPPDVILCDALPGQFPVNRQIRVFGEDYDLDAAGQAYFQTNVTTGHKAAFITRQSMQYIAENFVLRQTQTKGYVCPLVKYDWKWALSTGRCVSLSGYDCRPIQDVLPETEKKEESRDGRCSQVSLFYVRKAASLESNLIGIHRFLRAIYSLTSETDDNSDENNAGYHDPYMQLDARKNIIDIDDVLSAADSDVNTLRTWRDYYSNSDNNNDNNNNSEKARGGGRKNQKGARRR